MEVNDLPAIQGYLGAVYVKDSPTSTAATGLAMTDSGDHMTYYVTDPTKRYWDTGATVTVKKNGTPVSSGFTIEYCGGRVIFTAANQATDVITVDASYWSVTEEANMFNWELDIERDDQDVTTFGSSWKQIAPALASVSGSAEWYWASNKFLQRLGDKEMVFVLYVNEASNQRYEFYGMLTKEKIKTPVDGIVTEELEFKAKGKVYYRGA